MLNAGNIFYFLFSRYLKRQMLDPWFVLFFYRKQTKIAQTQIKNWTFIILLSLVPLKLQIKTESSISYTQLSPDVLLNTVFSNKCINAHPLIHCARVTLIRLSIFFGQMSTVVDLFSSHVIGGKLRPKSDLAPGQVDRV